MLWTTTMAKSERTKQTPSIKHSGGIKFPNEYEDNGKDEVSEVNHSAFFATAGLML